MLSASSESPCRDGLAESLWAYGLMTLPFRSSQDWRTCNNGSSMSSADGCKEGWSEAHLAYGLMIGTISEMAHMGDEIAPVESSSKGGD